MHIPHTHTHTLPKADVLSLLPLDILYAVPTLRFNVLLRLPRLLKVNRVACLLLQVSLTFQQSGCERVWCLYLAVVLQKKKAAVNDVNDYMSLAVLNWETTI